ncbi:hypothetical protein SFC65_27475 [Priestia filamentosa]|uniref:hypothetical protein n=1 Tax=Priestia filamentosa TaxID=1402861 RepID=UPI003981CC1B
MSTKAIESIIFFLVGVLLALFLFNWNPMGLSVSAGRWTIVGYIILYVIYRVIVDRNRAKKGGTD